MHFFVVLSLKNTHYFWAVQKRASRFLSCNPSRLHLFRDDLKKILLSIFGVQVFYKFFFKLHVNLSISICTWFYVHIYNEYNSKEYKFSFKFHVNLSVSICTWFYVYIYNEYNSKCGFDVNLLETRVGFAGFKSLCFVHSPFFLNVMAT